MGARKGGAGLSNSVSSSDVIRQLPDYFFNPFNDLTSIDCALTNPRASIISTISSLTWRNGRRVRLRTVWGNPWRFDSSREQILLTLGSALSRVSTVQLMKKIILFLFCAFLCAPVILLRAQEAAEKPTFPGVRKAMPAEDYEAAGLEKLSEDERERLDEFIRKYVSRTSEKVAEKAATEAVDEAVKRQEGTPPRVIQSR